MLDSIFASRRLARAIPLKAWGAIALCALLSKGCKAQNANLSDSATNTATATATPTVTLQRSDYATSPAVANATEVAVTPTTTAPMPKAPAPKAPAPIAVDPATKASRDEWRYEDRIGPEFGILEAVDPGDERCYLSLKAQDGQTYTLGATFVVCTDEYLNQAVQLTYERLTSLSCPDVSDDCSEMAVTAIAPDKTDQVVKTRYSNQDWDIIVSSVEPWSGVNGTGNATYKGCDPEGNCIELGGGTSTCRDGECWTTWHNGNARYSIIEKIGEEASKTARLLVLMDGQVGVDDSSLQINGYPNP